MFNAELQKNLEAETYSYGLDIINAILLNDNWEESNGKLYAKYYIDNDIDGKVLVILTKPIKIYPLKVKERNDRETINIDNAIRDLLVRLGVNVKYDEDADVNKLLVDVKRYKEVLNNYYGILQSCRHVIVSEERIKSLLNNIIETFMEKSKWTDTKGLSYLNYDIKYENEVLHIYINSKEVKCIYMNVDEYYKVNSLFERELSKYKIIKYGNGASTKYLSSYDILGSIKLFYNYEEQMMLRRNYC